MGVLIAVREFGSSAGHKIGVPDRSLIQYPWGMHICDYQQQQKIDIVLVFRRVMPTATHVETELHQEFYLK